MKVLFENTWVIDDGGVRIFVLAGDDEALVIDTGISGLDIPELVRGVTDLPFKLLNTHADMDHIAGNKAFSRMYMHPSEACVYHVLNHGAGEIMPVYDGTLLDLGNRPLKIRHVPGHTPGSITVLDVKNRCLIGGDPIQAGGDIYMFGPYRDMEAYVLGLTHLLEQEASFDCIYPSHAGMPVDKSLIPDLIRGARDVMDGKIAGIKKEMHGRTVMSYDIGIDRFLCDMD